jgi:hypothetical protein
LQGVAKLNSGNLDLRESNQRATCLSCWSGHASAVQRGGALQSPDGLDLESGIISETAWSRLRVVAQTIPGNLDIFSSRGTCLPCVSSPSMPELWGGLTCKVSSGRDLERSFISQTPWSHLQGVAQTISGKLDLRESDQGVRASSVSPAMPVLSEGVACNSSKCGQHLESGFISETARSHLQGVAHTIPAIDNSASYQESRASSVDPAMPQPFARLACNLPAGKTLKVVL